VIGFDGVLLTHTDDTQPKENAMAIKVGDRIPDGTLTELITDERPGCTVGPNAFQVADLTKGKKVVIFGVPGAFTPTCSAKHVPSYVQNIDKLKAKGVNEVWCVSVNDAFVMGAWGKDQKAGGKVRMMADGSATYAKALGLDMDLIARGMGVRSQRYSMLVEDGVVKRLNVEAPGKFEVSSGEAMLAQL
jgi:peroxiredoxin